MDAVGTRIPASPWNPGLANGGLCVRGRAGLLHEARLRLRLMPDALPLGGPRRLGSFGGPGIKIRSR